MSRFIAELFISMYKIKFENFSRLYGMIYCIEFVSEKTCQKSFNDVHFILNLQKLLEFVGYSSIVVVARPEFWRLLYGGKYTQCNGGCVKLVRKHFDDLLYINI